MRNPAFVIAATALLGACGSETSGTFTTEDGGKGEYAVDAEGESMTATVKTEDGTATMQSGPDAKPDLPKGFTVYPGGTIITVSNVKQKGESGSMMMFETTDSPEKVAAFYKKQAEAAGFEITTEADVNGSKTIAGETADKTSFMINANGSGDKTAAQLVIGKGAGN